MQISGSACAVCAVKTSRGPLGDHAVVKDRWESVRKTLRAACTCHWHHLTEFCEYILRSIAKRLHEEYMHRKVRSFIRHKKMPHESYIYFNDSDNSQSSSINLDASSMPRQMECHAQIANWIKSPAHPYAPISLTLDEKIWGQI
jgi:hypothetical protein